MLELGVTSNNLTQASPLLLDSLSAYRAYSLRKLRTLHAGNCIRVRRSTDNAEQDIGFVADYLDTASLLAFCGVGSGYITTVYDQSANAVNRVQTVTTRQPRIVNAGALDLEGSKTKINFYNSSSMLTHSAGYMPSSAAYSFFNVYKRTTNTSILYVGGTNQFAWVGSSGDGSSAFGQFTNGTNYKNGSTVTISTRAQVVTQLPTNTLLAHSCTNYTIGAWSNAWWFGGYNNVGGGFDWQGSYMEEIIFQGNQASIMTQITDNQKTYYGL